MGGEHDQLTSFSNSACLSTAAMHFLHTPSFLQKILKKGQNSMFSRKTRLKTQHTKLCCYSLVACLCLTGFVVSLVVPEEDLSVVALQLTYIALRARDSAAGNFQK